MSLHVDSISVSEILNMTAVGEGKTLTVNVTSAKLNGGKYYCAALNDDEFEVSNSSTVYIVPEITVHPVNQYVEIDTTVELMCKAEGYPSVSSYQWQKDGVNIRGQNMSTIRFNEIGPSDIGMYRCIASNTIEDQTYNATSNEALIAISPAGKVQILPSSMQQFIALVDSQVIFHCTAEGTGPDNVFLWFLNIEDVICSNCSDGFNATGKLIVVLLIIHCL